MSVDFSRIYQAMRQSEMNAWVGNADPELAGEISASILLRHVPVDAETSLLDFGVGVGRVAAGVLHQRPQIKSLIGIDIVPRLVEFCQSQIASQFSNVKFELLADQNAHYEKYKFQDQAKPRTRQELIAAYGGSIDCAYAFSVFTHVDVSDFVDLLRFVGALLKPGGRFFFTVFALTAYSRAQIAAGKTTLAVPLSQYEEDGAVFIGNTADLLAFIGYDIARLEQMIWEAGLVCAEIEYGGWRGDGFSGSLQDVLVCRKPAE
jgi:SAM-dependent methyltransferase